MLLNGRVEKNILYDESTDMYFAPQMLIFNKLSLAPGYICSLHPKNILFCCQKNSHLHHDNLCAFVQFCEKTIFFMVDVKRRKIYHKKPYF
jgi:hypothetical protein